MDVLLIGEDVKFLRFVALELSLRGFNVTVVNDPDALKPAIELLSPDVVVLDHVEPMDFFVLNPRDYGYEGTLLVLSTGDVPAGCLEELATSHQLKKPISLEGLCERLAMVTTA
jgi:DNA-binding response OmpR family regulator